MLQKGDEGRADAALLLEPHRCHRLLLLLQLQLQVRPERVAVGVAMEVAVVVVATMPAPCEAPTWIGPYVVGMVNIVASFRLSELAH